MGIRTTPRSLRTISPIWWPSGTWRTHSGAGPLRLPGFERGNGVAVSRIPSIGIKGFSSYNGLLLTINKNLSHGLKFDFNYTYSHSIDNTSLIANKGASNAGLGFICDVVHPRECRGSVGLFDETHVMNANFLYDLPIGHGRTFAATSPRWVDEVIGGWALSGIPQWHSGLAFTAYSGAFMPVCKQCAGDLQRKAGHRRGARAQGSGRFREPVQRWDRRGECIQRSGGIDHRQPQ